MKTARHIAALLVLAASITFTATQAQAQGVTRATPTCAGLAATHTWDGGSTYNDRPFIFGTPGDDVIVGTNKNDVIYGLGGDDVICGRRGNDLIDGDRPRGFTIDGWTDDGYGADVIYGGGGNDRIFGNSGNDTVYGGADNDRIWGDNSTGRDIRPGDDRMYGGSGDDTIYGGAGSDRAGGQSGSDSCAADIEVTRTCETTI